MLFMTIKKNTIIVITTAISGETNLEKSIILGEWINNFLIYNDYTYN